MEGKGMEGKGMEGKGNGRELAETFNLFWATYPNKVRKQDAQKAWMKLCPDQALTTKLLAAIEVHKCSEQWAKDGGKFIPHPPTWLNQQRWEDELRPAVKSSRVSAGAAPVPGKYDHLER
jgi:hypothetical protein